MVIKPVETHAPLIVDADAPLAFSRAFQNFETCPGCFLYILTSCQKSYFTCHIHENGLTTRSMDTEKNTDQNPPPWKIIWGTVGLFLIIYILYTVFAWRSSSESKVSAFGDAFGAFNALFAGFGFIGLAFTIYLQNQQLKMQQHELALQREELVMNRQQLTRSAKAQEESEQALRDQLRVMSLSSRLNAITMQLGMAYDHAMTHVNMNEVRTFSDSSLDRYLNNAQSRILQNNPQNGDACVINDLKTIIDLRRDLVQIHTELRAL